MEKTQETASVDCGDELQKIYKVQPRLPRLHLSIISGKHNDYISGVI